MQGSNKVEVKRETDKANVVDCLSESRAMSQECATLTKNMKFQMDKYKSFEKDSVRYIKSGRGDRNEVLGEIKDERLTLTMDRTRSGATQVFREYLKPDGTRYMTFSTNDPEGVIEIEAPKRHIYSAIVDDKWHWVNGCGPCNGEPRDWRNTYIECDNHNVCSVCGIHTSDEKVTARHGNKGGWICNVCYERKEREHREYMLANARDYDRWDFSGLDTPECPYCNEKINEWWKTFNDRDGDQKHECYTCKNTFLVTPEVSVTFSCLKEGD